MIPSLSLHNLQRILRPKLPCLRSTGLAMLNQGHPSIFFEWPWFQSLTCDAGGSPCTCLERHPSHEIDTWALLSPRQRTKPGIKLLDLHKFFAPFILCSVAIFLLEVVSLFRMFVSLLPGTSQWHLRIRSIGALRSHCTSNRKHTMVTGLDFGFLVEQGRAKKAGNWECRGPDVRSCSLILLQGKLEQLVLNLNPKQVVSIKRNQVSSQKSELQWTARLSFLRDWVKMIEGLSGNPNSLLPRFSSWFFSMSSVWFWRPLVNFWQRLTGGATHGHLTSLTSLTSRTPRQLVSDGCSTIQAAKLNWWISDVTLHRWTATLPHVFFFRFWSSLWLIASRCLWCTCA